MKRKPLSTLSIRFACVCFLVAHAQAQAQESTAPSPEKAGGIGLLLGDPTALNGKLFLSSNFALDAAIGVGFYDGDHLAIHMDALWQLKLHTWSAGHLDFFLGAGPKFGVFGDRHRHHDGHDHRVRLGLRIPFGLSFMFANSPFDIFLEIAPGLWFVPDVHFAMDAGIGFRYWF